MRELETCELKYQDTYLVDAKQKSLPLTVLVFEELVSREGAAQIPGNHLLGRR
jgi:hypothetical protein